MKSALDQVTEAVNAETKSTAGDKHETSRAMMQIEQEKLGKQLKELLAQKQELEKTDIQTSSQKVGKGSLVRTDKGYLFISVGLGKLSFGADTVIAISYLSPLAKKLLGKGSQESIEMNGIRYTIHAIE